MTCAKYRTIAVIIGRSGKRYVGENLCACPQGSCPREIGEGYAKCHEICKQISHAEVAALLLAGEDARGGSIEVNHWYFCDDCRAACIAAGIVSFIATGPRYCAPTPGAVKELDHESSEANH